MQRCPTYWCTFEEIIHWFHILVQTAYYFYAKGVYLRADNLQNDRNARWFAVKKHLFLGTLLVYAVSNLCVWGKDLFIETHNIQAMFQKAYYPGNAWFYLYFTFNPADINVSS